MAPTAGFRLGEFLSAGGIKSALGAVGGAAGDALTIEVHAPTPRLPPIPLSPPRLPPTSRRRPPTARRRPHPHPLPSPHSSGGCEIRPSSPPLPLLAHPLFSPATPLCCSHQRWPIPATSGGHGRREAHSRGRLPPLRRLLRPDPSVPASSARPQPLPSAARVSGAGAPPSTARLRRPWWLLSDAYSASSRGCSGAPDRERRSGRQLLPRRGPARRRRGPARRRLHCSEFLRPAAAGAMEVHPPLSRNREFLLTINGF